MKQSLVKTCLFAALLSAAVFVAAASAGAQDPVAKSFSVKPGGTLTLESDLGSIEVRGAGGDKVDVEVIREARPGFKSEAERILRDLDVRMDQSGNDVTVTLEFDQGLPRRLFDNPGRYLKVRFVVGVPESYNLDLETRGGGISVDNVRGTIKGRTSGGSLSFDRIEGEITARTSGGGIDIGAVKGNTSVRTSGGSIRIRSAAGPVDAHTSGGGITVEEVAGAITANTSGGSVRATITRRPEADCRLTTSGGSITVMLADGIEVDIDARTSGGSVSSDLPVTVQGRLSRRSLTAKIGAGGPQLYLRTSGGSIRLRQI